jgi:hypothetical protein
MIAEINILDLFGAKLFDPKDSLEFMIKFAFNLSVILILVRFLYYPVAKRKDYLFTYILLGMVIFLLCFVLKGKNLDTGLALGLFAIFGIIRYRTRQIPIKEMTYLFLVIGISVVNALVSKKVSVVELVFANFALIAITYGLEKVWLLKHESSKTVIYEKIELIKPEHRQELLEDLQYRTGINISRIEIGRVDFLKDVARIKIYYFESENRINMADNTDDYMPDDEDDD